MIGKRIRILHLVGDGEAGGVNSFIRALAGAIDRSRFEFEVCNLGCEGAGLRELRESGMKTHSISETGPLGLRGILRYFRRARSGRYDIVHAHVGARIPRLVARLAMCRTVSHVHGLPESWLGQRAPTDPGPKSEINVAFGIGSDSIVSCSRGVERCLTQACPALESRSCVIHNGIALDRWRAFETGRIRQRRAAAGIPANAIVVGFAGRLVPVKRIDCMVEAAMQLLPKHPQIQFLFLGDGVLRPVLEQQAASLGNRVRFIGNGSAAEWLPLFDILVLASESEGLPYSILEAMACAIPVVATSVGGIPEAVVHGETGILIPPGDSSALADAIDSFVRNPELRRSFGAAGRARAENLFDARKMAREFEGLYAKLA